MSGLDLDFINEFLLHVWKEDLAVTPKQFLPLPSFEKHLDIVQHEQQVAKEDKASSRRTIVVNERIMKLQQENPLTLVGI